MELYVSSALCENIFGQGDFWAAEILWVTWSGRRHILESEERLVPRRAAIRSRMKNVAHRLPNWPVDTHVRGAPVVSQ